MQTMMTITDILSDDLLREVFTFLPVGSFLPVAHVCKAFKRCWILSKKTNDDDELNKKENAYDMMMIYSTKPFRVGMLYDFDWNHSCYEDVSPNSTSSFKRKETTATTTSESTLTIKITEEEEEETSIPSGTNKKQKIETRSVSVGSLNQSLFQYFVCDMGWITKYRSLLQRKLVTKLLVMAAQRGDIEGMNYMLFQMEPIELRTRLYRYCHGHDNKTFQKRKCLSSSSSSSGDEEVDLDANANADADALSHAQDNDDLPLDDDDEALLLSFSSAEEEGEEEESEDDEEMPALALPSPSTSPFNPYDTKTMVNVTQPVQELCLNTAAAGRLDALHWLLHIAFQMTWLCQKDGLEVHQEAKSNDHADVAKYIMLTMTINFSPFKAHQRSATAQLKSMMSTTLSSISSTTKSIGSNKD